MGDVTLIAPTATVCFPVRGPGCLSHHWSTVSCSRTSIAHKGITAGARVAAYTALYLLTDPERLGPIRREFEDLAHARPYKTFLPAEAEPPLGWNAALMEKYRSDKYRADIET